MTQKTAAIVNATVLTLLGTAIGYVAALAQYSVRISLVEERVHVMAPKVDAVYDGLVLRGIIPPIKVTQP